MRKMVAELDTPSSASNTTAGVGSPLSTTSAWEVPPDEQTFFPLFDFFFSFFDKGFGTDSPLAASVISNTLGGTGSTHSANAVQGFFRRILVSAFETIS